MRIFPTKQVKALVKNTWNRVETIKSLPPEFHEECAGIFRIEKVDNWLREFDPFYQEITTRLDGGADGVSLSDRLAYKLAFYLHQIALFFQHFGDHNDFQYIQDVEVFFGMYGAEVGVRSEETLFLNAFGE